MPLLTGFAFGGGIGKATYTSQSGGTVDTSSRAGKTIVKFTGSGSVTIGSAGYCEVLIIGGGGAGGWGGGSAGGGAGAMYYNASHLVTSGTLTVTVGSGGAWSSNIYAPSYPGGSSALGTFLVPGGGNGGGAGSAPGSSGGSGGASFANTTYTIHGGLALNPAWGNNGGTGIAGYTNYAGGGGGAGSVGSDASTSSGPISGGSGLANSITGTSVTYAAGGAGSASSATAGATNTGGGGSGSNTGSGVGGSGYVVVVFG